MTFSPFVSFRYNSVPSPSLDHVLYVHSRSYCTFSIIFLMHLSFVFFFPAQHYIGGSLDPNDHHWEMHSVRLGFHFPGLLLDCTQCKFSFFKAQRCIERSLDPNDHMWDTHSLRIFHFSALLLDYTQSRFQRIVQK